MCDIATVGFWRRPAECIFLRLRTLEELGGGGEGGFYGGGGDGMVVQVDEACCLESVEDFLGDGGALFWGAVEEE